MKSVRNSGRLAIVSLAAAAGMMVLSGAGFQPEKPATPAKPAGQPEVKPAAPAASNEPLPSVDTVMDKFIGATGGKANWEKVKSMMMEQTTDIPALGIKGKGVTWVGENGKMYMELDIPNLGKMQQGSDGETVWSMEASQGPRILEGEERDLQLSVSKMNNPLDWKKLFSTIEVQSVEKVLDKPAYKVQGTTAVGKLPLTFWFDKESGLMNKMFIKTQGPQGEVTVEALLSEYKEVSGVKMAHVTKRTIMGQIEMTETMQKLEINPKIADDRFALPAEIKELKDAEKPAAKPGEKPATPETPAKPEKK